MFEKTKSIVEQLEVTDSGSYLVPEEVLIRLSYNDMSDYYQLLDDLVHAYPHFEFEFVWSIGGPGMKISWRRKK